MADPSFGRRSSRAKTSQSRSHISSATSSSSGRSTRAFIKTGSPQKSTESASLSSEPLDEVSYNNDDQSNSALRRRSTRGRDEIERDHKPTKIDLRDMAPASGDDLGDDDEAVRCICGNDDYPGPPQYDADAKHGFKDPIEFQRIFGLEVTDDIAGNFVQCEECKSWQHSACVGFTTEEDVEYWCEQCRPNLHRVYVAGIG